MKLLYTVILLLGIIQLSTTKSLNSYYEQELAEFYDEELNIIAGEICIKLRNITEELLNDKIIQKSSGVLTQEFKKNISHFQQINKFYVQYGFNETMVITISNMLKSYSHPESNANKEYLYIKQLLKKVGYDALREEYKIKLGKFVSEIFLPELQEMKRKIPLCEFDIQFTKWINNLRECVEYECYLNTLRKATFTAKDQLVGSIQRQLLDMTILYLNDAIQFSKRTLKNPQLSQLSPYLRQKVTSLVEEVLKITDAIEEIFQIFFIPLNYHSLIYSLCSDDNITVQELDMVLNVLNDQGYSQLELNHKANYDNFLKSDLVKEVERFRSSLSAEELIEEKTFLETFDRLKNANTFEERVSIVNGVDKKPFLESRI